MLAHYHLKPLTRSRYGDDSTDLDPPLFLTAGHLVGLMFRNGAISRELLRRPAINRLVSVRYLFL